MSQPVEARKPEPNSAPPDDAWQNLTQWQALTADGPQQVMATATVWRNGLAGFVTLLTSSLILTGADLSEIGSWHKWVAIAGVLGGIALSLAGLWAALTAQAPPTTEGNYDDVIEKHGSITGWRQNAANDARNRLALGRKLVVAALAFLLVGIGFWWSAPAPTASKLAKVFWTQDGQQKVVCGELVPAAAREIVIQPNNATDATRIPAPSIVTIALLDTCD